MVLLVFQTNSTSPSNVTTLTVHACSEVDAPQDECTLTRVAFLLLAFHSKAWIFGALYYWLTWAFLAVVLMGAGVTLYRARTYVEVEGEDTEELLDEGNPFRT